MTFISKISPSGCFNLMAGAVVAGALSCSLVSTAEAAPASTQQEVDFSFYRTAPVTQTYKDFERTARRACQSDSTMAKLTRLRLDERKCAADLLDRAVEKAGIPALITYHADQAAPAPRTTISSSR
ncbi:MAG: hypothetical protein WA989_14420 [Henriciella sp.]|uniref:hypothetical protein n=1 Tax=Henriciella sp. TaxID=1968823 RepID=UPI003C730077